MAGNLYILTQHRLIDRNGVASGGSIYFYQTGTSIIAPIYVDKALTTPMANPVIVDADANIPNIYLDPLVTYRQVIVYTDGSQDVQDPYEEIGADSGSGDAPTLGTLKTTNIPAAVLYIQSSGYYSAGDGGAANYKRVSSNPNLGAGSFQTADGAWWAYVVQGPINLQQLGAKQDCPMPWVDFTNYASSGYTSSWTVPPGITDNAQCLIDAYAIATQTYPPNNTVDSIGSMIPIQIFAGPDTTKCFYMSSFPTPLTAVKIVGNCMGGDNPYSGTVIRLPPNTVGLVLPAFTNTAQHGYLAPTGSIIEGIWFQGGGGVNRAAHGFKPRTTHTLINCVFDSFAGDNINCSATNQVSAGDGYGLTSGSLWLNVTCRAAGNNNTIIQGSDSSASTSYNLHHKGSRLAGLLDLSPFANQHYAYQNNQHGDGHLGACYNAGRHYAFVSLTAGSGSTTTPGTDETVWADLGALSAATTQYPQWSSSGTYILSVPCCSTAFGSAIMGYVENYYLPSITPNVSSGYGAILTGAMNPQNTAASMTYYSTGGAIVSGVGMGQLVNYNTPDPIMGASKLSTAGGLGVVTGAVMRGADQGYRYTYSWMADGLRWGNGIDGGGFGPITFTTTAANTTTKFGRTTALANQFYVDALVVGTGNGNMSTGRKQTYVTGRPTSGEVAVGEIFWNLNPAVGQPMGWMGVTAGVIGSGGVVATMPNLTA